MRFFAPDLGVRLTIWRTSAVILVLLAGLAGCGGHVYHQVQTGETLYSISWQYGHSYEDVARWNALAPPYVIQPGQWLRMLPTDEVAHARSATSLPQATAVLKPAVPDPAIDREAQFQPGHWQWPARGTVIRRFQSDGPGRKGIDIAGQSGDPVFAAAAGRVVYSGNGLRGYGNLVIIKHDDRYLSAYAHNDVLLVQEGDPVVQGQRIGTMGTTGAERVMLHFEIRIDGKPVDPMRYLPVSES